MLLTEAMFVTGWRRTARRATAFYEHVEARHYEDERCKANCEQGEGGDQLVDDVKLRQHDDG